MSVMSCDCSVDIVVMLGFVHINICVYVYIYIYIYIQLHIYIYIYIYICFHVFYWIDLVDACDDIGHGEEGERHKDQEEHQVPGVHHHEVLYNNYNKTILC